MVGPGLSIDSIRRAERGVTIAYDTAMAICARLNLSADEYLVPEDDPVSLSIGSSFVHRDDKKVEWILKYTPVETIKPEKSMFALSPISLMLNFFPIQGFIFIAIKNQGGEPLHILRAVFFQEGNKTFKVFVWRDAFRSQKYPTGYELKFGDTFSRLDTAIAPGEIAETHLPLAEWSEPVPNAGERGSLLLEYVSSGRSRIYRALL